MIHSIAAATRNEMLIWLFLHHGLAWQVYMHCYGYWNYPWIFQLPLRFRQFVKKAQMSVCYSSILMLSFWPGWTSMQYWRVCKSIQFSKFELTRAITILSTTCVSDKSKIAVSVCYCNMQVITPEESKLYVHQNHYTSICESKLNTNFP